MLKVTITALSGPVTIQDPKPVSQTSSAQAVITVEHGTPASWVMQWQQLERVRDQLVDLEALGLISYVIESAGTADFAEQAMGEDNPEITGLDNGGATLTVLSDTPKILGTNLIGSNVQATAVVESTATATGSIALAAIPGAEGNLIDFQVIDSGAAAADCTTAVVAGRTVITVNLKGQAAETCTTIAALINGACDGICFATVVGVGATVIDAVQALTPFTGGSGPGMTILFGGLACAITSVDDSAAPIYEILVTTTALTGVLAAGDVAVMSVRAGNKIATASSVLA